MMQMHEWCDRMKSNEGEGNNNNSNWITGEPYKVRLVQQVITLMKSSWGINGLNALICS